MSGSILQTGLTGVTCDHRKLVRRPPERMTPEQRWCGAWSDCPACGYSVLVPSTELREYLDESAGPATVGAK